MSEVNQAYLRAYLKSRVSQPAHEPTAAATATAATNSLPMSPANRPSDLGPRPNVQESQPGRTTSEGNHLRFDSSHTGNAVNTSDRGHSATGVQPAAIAKQGVWSPLGVERGMKAMESQSVPAIVRNGVSSVSKEATPSRHSARSHAINPTPTQAPSSRTAQAQSPQAHAPQAPSLQAPSSGEHSVQYDQVMYVDGLEGHANRRPISPTIPSEKTLAEITEPIAIGAGTPAPMTPPHKPPMGAPKTSTQTQPSTQTSRHADSLVSRRFDPAHARTPITAPANEVPPPAVSKPAPPAMPALFTPSWEVDTFFWPEVVKQIETSHGDSFQQIGKHLGLANRDGLKVMAVTSGERGVGRSTVAMHMARAAAAAGVRVALIDGDTFCPSLVDQLRLDAEHGWQDCLFENVPLHEVAIHSVADNVTFFPLTSVISQQQLHANLHRISKMIKRVSAAFDMVFIDANRLNLEQRDMVGVGQDTVVDAAIVVVDTELSVKEKVDTAVSILQGMGLSSIGLVENFQS